MPGWSICRSLNVATPATALCDGVPVSAPLPGFAPIATLTAPVNAAVVLPKGSRAVTSMAGAIADPTNDGLGCTVNASCDAAPGVTVMSGRAVVTVAPFTVARIVIAVPAACPVNGAV